jgi:hypothetical protein
MTEIELSPNTKKFIFIQDGSRILFFTKTLLTNATLEFRVVNEFDLFTYEEIYSNNVLVGYAFVFVNRKNLLCTSNMIVSTEADDFIFSSSATMVKLTYFMIIREVNNLVILGGDKK